MPEQTSVIILGAGPSGLAAAGCLREKGVPFIVVERAGAVGSTWRAHYERLHLHTIKQFSALPGLPWPSTVPMYPSRAEVVAYLERYAAKFQIEPRFGCEVTSARHDGAQWVVRAGESEIHARGLIVATGYNRVPKQPSWPGQSTFRGEIIHSSAYRNGAAWKGKRALVVGIGNSGGEIAIDLWEHGARGHPGAPRAASVCAADRAGAESRLRFYVNSNSSSRPKARGRREGEGVPRERCTRGSGARRRGFSVVARRVRRAREGSWLRDRPSLA